MLHCITSPHFTSITFTLIYVQSGHILPFHRRLARKTQPRRTLDGQRPLLGACTLISLKQLHFTFGRVLHCVRCLCSCSNLRQSHACLGNKPRFIAPTCARIQKKTQRRGGRERDGSREQPPFPIAAHNYNCQSQSTSFAL